MKRTGTFAEARALGKGVVGLVPTMGFLHEGHLSLLEAARQSCETVVMSLYVNPLQFGEPDDLARYPRDLERDLGLAAEAGVDVVFVPGPAEMFPTEPATQVHLPALTETMEGTHRPGHLEGVATVVAKLFAGLQPDRAFFGRKDAQQLTVVRRLAADLSFPVEIVGSSIVRESDGLALSSRNVLLNGSGRRAALALHAGLFTAADLVDAGEREVRVLEDAARAVSADTDGVDLEYASLATQEEAALVSTLEQPSFLAVAARVGGVRLIDNVHFDPGPGGISVDRGKRLDRPSIVYGVP